ncbi:MAG: hypothetical protein K9I85_09515 [Saprospiraceae bacterium]|nr:hypothetical protein [Saprospiraceae bacterium]
MIFNDLVLRIPCALGKVVAIGFLFLISGSRGYSQSLLDGVYSSDVEGSRLRLVVFEKNLEIYAKYQYFQKMKKSRPTVEKIFSGYRNEDGYIYFNRPHEALFSMNSGDATPYRNFRIKQLAYYKSITPEPPNRIVQLSEMNVAPNHVLHRQDDQAGMVQELRAEVALRQGQLYPQNGRWIRKITDDHSYSNYLGEDWIMCKHNGRHVRLLLDPGNIVDQTILKVYLLPQEKYPLVEMKSLLDFWTKNSRQLIDVCYPSVTTMEIYHVLNRDEKLPGFLPDRFVLVGHRKGRANGFEFTLTSHGKKEISSVHLGHIARLNEIERVKDQYYAMSLLMQLKHEVQHGADKETDIFEEIMNRIDALEVDIRAILLKRSYSDLSSRTGDDQAGLMRWYQNHSEAFGSFSENVAYRDKDQAEIELEKLYWNKCRAYWKEHIDRLCAEVDSCENQRSLDRLKEDYDFLFSISRIYDEDGYFARFLAAYNGRLAYWKWKEDERVRNFEEEQHRLAEERQQRIDSGELCRCCNNSRLVCQKCKGGGTVHRYNGFLGRWNYDYCCLGGVIKCHCCGMKY